MTIEMRARSFPVERLGIETEYAGTVFRSRLEARWAAMFDLLKWRWEYEPLDLAGYIPDFMLALPRAPLLVEVKPAISFDELRDAERKIRMGGWRRDYLVVGAGPFEGVSDPQTLTLGLLCYWESPSAPAGEWGPADRAEMHRCGRCRAISAHHASDTWKCLVCGAYDGARLLDHLDPREVRALWAKAGNKVQWRPGGA
jgi:hypothetical protein